MTKQDQAEEQVMDTDTDMNSVSKDTEDVDASPDQPKDLTCEKQVVEPNQEAESKMTSLENNSPQQSYDIIKNLTEKYGNKVGTESVFETRKSNLENVLSKMSKPDEDNECEDEGDVDHEMNDEDQEKEHPGDLESEEVKDVYDFDQEQKPEYKPIKLKIARGEIVENTAIEREHAIKVEIGCENFTNILLTSFSNLFFIDQIYWSVIPEFQGFCTPAQSKHYIETILSDHDRK